MLAAGVKVGLGVDGGASNDGGHLLAEARQALLLQRVKAGAGALSASQCVEMLTLGGAGALGRDDIGSLEKGKAADFVGFDLHTLGYAGALHDPVAALVFCSPQQVELSVIDGQVVVQGGEIVGLDIPRLVSSHNRLAKEMVTRAEARMGTSFTTHLWRWL
jgi:cytosine/adenosine deaminase-related metal-dependent hydrolase